MTDIIAWVSLAASIILLVAGLYELLLSWKANATLRTATDNAAQVGEQVNKDTDSLAEHAGIDFKGQWEALAALAAALKDLDRSTRLLLLSLAFMAVAAATVGVTSIASAITAA